MSSRTKRFSVGILTGYSAIIVNVAYTLLSVPLALHFLGKEEFGLWALAQQVAGYFLLLDFGMSNAISRFYADCKDDVNSTEYKRLLATSIMVYAVQGGGIALGGIMFSWIAPEVFHIPDAISHSFQVTLLIISISSGVSVALRSIGGPIWSFQRMDVMHMLALSSLIINYCVLWLGFRAGWGIYSFALAGIPSVLLAPLVGFFVCRASGYYPKSGLSEKPSKELFWKIFNFGRDSLLLSLGQQMVNASQIMLISRTIGLDAAATFTIGVKIYSMAQQFISKILDSSAAGLTEIYVRGDHSRFRKRFWDILNISSLLGCAGAALLMLSNQSLLRIWTKGSINWPSSCDLVLALMLIFTTFSRCFTGIFGLVGNLRPIRSIYFIEGIFFLLCSWYAAENFGIFGVLFTSLVIHIIVTLIKSIYCSRQYLVKMDPFFKTLYLSITLIALSSIINFTINKRISLFNQKLFYEGMAILFIFVLSVFFLCPQNLYNSILKKIYNNKMPD